MRCNPSRWLWGLIPIAMLSWGTYYRERPHVEADLTQRALEALRTAGQPWAKVTLTGRDAVITGRAKKDGEPKAALDAVRSVWGIRTVQLKTDLTGVAAAPEGIGPRAAAGHDAGTDTHKAKQEAERKAKGDAEAAARAAKHEAESAAGLKAQEEAKAKERAEAEHKVKQEAEARKAEAESARKAKEHAETQAALRAKEQTEAALKAQHEAEAALKAQEAEAAAALKAKDEEEAAARRRAEMDAAAAARKAHEESEARKAREAVEQKAKAEAEAAAALKAEQDVEAQRKAEADAAAAQKAKQEADMAAEAKADAEAEAKKRAEAEQARKTTAETQACEKRLTTAAAEGVILFKRASADIDPKSSITIARLAEIIKRCPGARVEVEGHTDNEGEPDRNQRLSERRARAVVSSLALAGVAGDRLSAVGYGATRPVAPNDTAQGMARNRRIEFKVFSD